MRGGGIDRPGDSGHARIASSRRKIYVVTDEGVVATSSLRMLRFTPWQEER